MSEGKTIPQESERRQATIMFADLSGFTAMSEKMDPEDVTSLMNDCFGMMAAVIERHGGHIDKYMGDCVMALFGVPTAIEEAPHKAINTAIDLRNSLYQFNREKQLERPLDIHIGINSGVVIAGQLGGGQKREFTVIGDVVNLASRLEDASEMGQIYVGETTYNLTRDDFEFKALSPIALKGKEQRVPVFELLSVKEQVHHRHLGESRMINSEMVGRDAELDKLRLHLLRVINGEGSIVNIIGEAGIGKSRLLAEFEQSEDIQKVHYLKGRGLSIGTHLSFHPLIEILKSWASIEEEEGDTAAREKLERTIRQIAPNEADEIFPFIATLMGMTLSGRHAERVKGIAGEALEKLILKNFRDLLTQVAAQKPLVMVIDDLHWIDISSLELLLSFFRLVTNNRIAFVSIFRPNYEETGDRLLQTVHEEFGDYTIDIPLQPLSGNQSETLVNNLLKIEGLPIAVRQQVIDRSEGNPFFIEEVIRSFIDEGIIEIRRGKFEVTSQIDSVVVPHSIHDLLMERIDRLDEKTRTLVRNAAVIGRSFFYKILSEIATTTEDMDERLSYLESVQLIQEGERQEELEYLFKHALAQEAAYESILLQQRKELHRSVADSIEKVFSERLHGFYGMLAMHYGKAEEWDKAEEYMLKAGEEALKSSASSEALHFFKEALSIYLRRHGDQVDEEKMAMMEKNIAYALFYRGQLAASLEYFNKVLIHYGMKLPRHPLSVLWQLLGSLVHLFVALYVPHLKWKRNPTQRDKDIFSLIVDKGGALVVADPQGYFTENLSYIGKELTNFDLAKIENGGGQFSTASALFSLTGISFSLSRKVLDFTRGKIKEEEEKSVIAYWLHEVVHDFLHGDWEVIEKYDEDLVSRYLTKGNAFLASHYSLWHFLSNLEQGCFSSAWRQVEKLLEISNVYENEDAKVLAAFIQCHFWAKKRQFREALCSAEKAIEYSKKPGNEQYLLSTLSQRAKCQVMAGNPQSAEENLQVAHKTAETITTYLFSTAWLLQSHFLFDLYRLEAAKRNGNKEEILSVQREAYRSGKKVVKLVQKVACERTEAYRSMGLYFWLINKQRKALLWWTRSIDEGEQLGAKPELSRTYFEVGKRLLEPQSKYKELNGISAEKYLEKARVLFEEMELEWDLAELEKVVGSFPSA